MSSSDADRNLLFGVVALQNNFIDRYALVAAFDRWSADKTRSLGQVLVESGAIAEADLSLLDALVTRYVAKFGDDTQKSLASMAAIDSVRDELKSIADPDLQASLCHIPANNDGGNDPWRTQAPSTMPMP